MEQAFHKWCFAIMEVRHHVKCVHHIAIYICDNPFFLKTRQCCVMVIGIIKADGEIPQSRWHVNISLILDHSSIIKDWSTLGWQTILLSTLHRQRSPRKNLSVSRPVSSWAQVRISPKWCLDDGQKGVMSCFKGASKRTVHVKTLWDKAYRQFSQ
jgi:hypothetical protein